MIQQIHNLDKAFESRIRLGIMTILMLEDSIDYTRLKAEMEVTDGNLASHLKALEKENYIKVTKAFFGRKPNTSYKITKTGRIAFEAHLTALEKLFGAIEAVKNEKK